MSQDFNYVYEFIRNILTNKPNELNTAFRVLANVDSYLKELAKPMKKKLNFIPKGLKRF